MKLPKIKPVRVPGMDIAVNFLNSRSVREKQVIFGIIIVLGVMLDFMLFVQPVARSLFEVAPKLPPLRQELRELKSVMKSKAAIAKDWQDAQATLQAREQIFVGSDGAPALLEDLSKEAQRTGVKIIALEPSESSDRIKGPYHRLPIQIRAQAGVHELGQFLSNLETGKTFFRVNDLGIMTNPQNERKHLVQLSLETYKREK